MSRAKLDRRPFPPAPAAPPPGEPFPAFDACALAVCLNCAEPLRDGETATCCDPRHAEPCPLPCAACDEECEVVP